MALSLLPSDQYGRMDTSSTSISPACAVASLPKAAQACISCRKQKRKCDKTLPACSLCARMGRQCDYTDTPSPPSADDLAILQDRLAELENRLATANSNDSSPAVTMDVSPTSTTNTNPPPPASDSDPRPPANNSRGPLWMSSLLPTNFPSAIFLDIDCFKWSGMQIPKPNVDVPPDVYALLINGTTIQDASSQYFDSIHPWFPIISRKRMSIGISLWEGGPDAAMLFLAMKLITYPSPTTGIPPADHPLYTTSKRFLALLESSGSLSLFHLQAMILVTLYELGHSIYPSAFMSVGACARYIDIIGLPSFKSSSTIIGSVTTWTELEERRRAWWAVYILDRLISLGNKKGPSMPEPEDNFTLPVSDSAWDAGDPGRSLQSPISAPLSQPQTPFARLAQAAMLISNILTHCRARISRFRRGDKSPPDMTYVQSLLQTTISFTDITTSELPTSPTITSPESYFSRLTPRCLAASATILLLDAYSCPENLCDGPGADGMDSFAPKSQSELDMQGTAVDGLRSVSLQMREISLEILEAVMLPTEQRRMSPLCLDALYCAMASLHWLWKEGGDEEVRTALEDVKNCLSRLAMRWRLAGEYVGMVHYHDVTMSMALRAGFS